MSAIGVWRDIEIAPKDGTEILGCWRHGIVGVTWYNTARGDDPRKPFWVCGVKGVAEFAPSEAPIYWIPKPMGRR